MTHFTQLQSGTAISNNVSNNNSFSTDPTCHISSNLNATVTSTTESNCSNCNNNDNNNYNNTNNNNNIQWNIWQQFQWPYVQPEQNRWSKFA